MNQILITAQTPTQLSTNLCQEPPPELIWRANFNSEQTTATYDFAVKQFMAFLGVTSFDEFRTVNIAHIIAYKKHLQNEGYKPNTINTRLSALSSLFNHLVDQQVVKHNPVAGVKRMREEYERVKTKCLSAEEARKLLDAPDTSKLRGLRDKAILATFFYAGPRISEIINLQVKDYFEEKGYHLLDFSLKGGRRNRIAISNELRVALDEYLAVAGHGVNPEAPLFISSIKGQNLSNLSKFSRKGLSKIWHKYAGMVGINGSSPHSARTTFITEALENNCKIDDVQKTVGHRSIKTTQRYDQRVFKYRESASFAVRY